MRKFLFLEMPHGPFGRTAIKFLQKSGITAYSISVNGGFLCDQNLKSIPFLGTSHKWPQFIKQQILNKSITDVVIYGHRRSYHTIVNKLIASLSSPSSKSKMNHHDIIMAEDIDYNIELEDSNSIRTFSHSSIRFHCLEEGYMRPGYITYEQGGVNSESQILDIYKQAVQKLESRNDGSDAMQYKSANLMTNCTSIKPIAISNPFANRIKLAILHYAGILLLYPFFMHYQWHRNQGILSEIFGWILRAGRDYYHSKADASSLEKLLNSYTVHDASNFQNDCDANYVNKTPNSHNQQFVKNNSSSIGNEISSFEEKIRKEEINKTSSRFDHTKTTASNTGSNEDLVANKFASDDTNHFRTSCQEQNSTARKSDSKLFFLPLQLNTDFQMKCSSSFRDSAEVVETVLSSFAMYSAPNDVLIVKHHPLDNTFFDYRTFTMSVASALGISQRVLFISKCSNKEVFSKISGLVTVNSTMGLTAVMEGIPTITLGEAFYAAKGLAIKTMHSGKPDISLLDEFWQHPTPPIKENVKIFEKILHEHAIIPGNFYTKEGIRQCLPTLLYRMGLGGISYCEILSRGISKIPCIGEFLWDNDTECVVGWGHKHTAQKAMELAKKKNIPYVALEDGFIKSLGNSAQPLSLCIDRNGIYYSAASYSDLFRILKHKESELSNEDLKNAEHIIDLMLRYGLGKANALGEDRRIQEQNLSKLNLCSVPREQRVLIIDQTFGDASVAAGHANKSTFKMMLDNAINQFGAQNVWVKIHPNVSLGKKRGYLSSMKLEKLGVHVIKESINPIRLAQSFKNVWVATSGFGFEALIAGCEVTCYGVPFYSGWGLTIDRIKEVKRARIRNARTATIAELVAAAIIKYSVWVHPVNCKKCNAVEAIEAVCKIIQESTIHPPKKNRKS